MNSISVNGKFIDPASPAITADNRSYRYGDGLFETMKVRDGKLLLAPLHFERLFNGLSVLQLERPVHFTAATITEEILQLCHKNNCSKLARVRLSVSSGQGGLYDGARKLNYIIETWPLGLEMEHLNSNGLVIGIYEQAHKSCDDLANLKSSSFLVYSMAALFARASKWNDALVLNNRSTIADSTIANLFMVKEGVIHTPPLADGCIAGVMRRSLVDHLTGWGYQFSETSISPALLASADEIFLTNAIRGLRWVKQVGDKTYHNKLCQDIYATLQTIWV